MEDGRLACQAKAVCAATDVVKRLPRQRMRSAEKMPLRGWIGHPPV